MDSKLPQPKVSIVLAQGGWIGVRKTRLELEQLLRGSAGIPACCIADILVG